MTAPTPAVKQVFISHAHEDNKFARKLAEALSAANVGVWFDVGNLKPGQRLDDVIKEALHASDGYIVILSPAAVDSHWVSSEWGEALERWEKGKLRYFIPILAAACEIPMRLKPLFWVDFTAMPWDTAFAQLAQGLGITLAPREAPRLWEQKQSISMHVGLFGLCWSPDGRMIATASHDKAVRIWDVASARCLQTFTGHENWVDAVAWSPDGRYLASASQGHRPRIWEVASGQQFALLEGHSDSITDIAWSPDGRSLITGSVDTTMRIWDLVTGRCLHVFTDVTKPLTSVAWSPDGAWLAATARDGMVHIWQFATKRHVRALTGHKDNVFRARWSPDGEQLASSGHSTVRIWNWRTGECLQIFTGHHGHVVSLAWRPDGKILASGSADRSVRLWGADGSRYVITPGMHRDWVHGVAWSPDGMTLASCAGIHDGQVILWQPA